MEVWHRHTTHLADPTVSIATTFNSACISNSILSRILTQLLVQIYTEKSNNLGYYAGLAGASINLTSGMDDLTLSVSCYNDRSLTIYNQFVNILTVDLLKDLNMDYLKTIITELKNQAEDVLTGSSVVL